MDMREQLKIRELSPGANTVPSQVRHVRALGFFQFWRLIA